jgi:transaldolase
MKPTNLNTKIFLDGGDPKETEEIKSLMGFLDGQTTNPSLVVKNPEIAAKVAEGQKFTSDELLNSYKEIITKLSSLMPEGSISIEVYSDKDTTAEQMLTQAKEMNSWIPNAHIKYPTSFEGLKAAEQSISLGIKVNMTLVFSQGQAAAVYTATRGARKGDVFISPFIGRLDDRGENGMQLIENIKKMYSSGDGHVEILAASARNTNHILGAIKAGADILTLPRKVIRGWFDEGMKVPDENFIYPKGELKDIPYQEQELEKTWQEFDLRHELTDTGLEKFASDWNALIKVSS